MLTISVFHWPSAISLFFNCLPLCYCSTSFLSFQLNSSHWRNSSIWRAKQNPPLISIQESLKIQTEVKLLRLLGWPVDHVEGTPVCWAVQERSAAAQTASASAAVLRGLSNCQYQLLMKLSQPNKAEWDFTYVACIKISKNKILNVSPFKHLSMNQL